MFVCLGLNATFNILAALNKGRYSSRGQNISILHLFCRMSDLQFSLVLQTQYLSFQRVYNKEHKGVICNMTYKVPYITVKMIFTQSNS